MGSHKLGTYGVAGPGLNGVQINSTQWSISLTLQGIWSLVEETTNELSTFSKAKQVLLWSPGWYWTCSLGHKTQTLLLQIPEACTTILDLNLSTLGYYVTACQQKYYYYCYKNSEERSDFWLHYQGTQDIWYESGLSDSQAPYKTEDWRNVFSPWAAHGFLSYLAVDHQWQV